MLIIHRKSIMLMHRPQTPQPGFGSITLLQKFTPHFKILDPRLHFHQLYKPAGSVDSVVNQWLCSPWSDFLLHLVPRGEDLCLQHGPCLTDSLWWKRMNPFLSKNENTKPDHDFCGKSTVQIPCYMNFRDLFISRHLKELCHEIQPN